MRVTLLHNPGAGDERHSGETICDLIAKAGHRVDYVPLDGDWKPSFAGEPDLFAIAGGDGAVGQVLVELAGRDVPAAVLPVGSANNIAASLGLVDDELDELVAGWHAARRHPYRPGRLTLSTGRLPFAETVGGGLFAEAIRRGQELEDETDDKVRLGLQVLQDLLRERPAEPWTLELDGDIVVQDFLAVEAMVIGRTGPGVPLAPGADPGDELLRVVAISERERAALLSYVRERLAGREPALEVPVQTAAHVVLHPDASQELRVDDELLEQPGRKLTLTSGADAVELLLPN